MSKRKYDPTLDLSQFIIGIYAYWRDKGVSIPSSKKRMYASTYEALNKLVDEGNTEMHYEEATKSLLQLVNSYGREISEEAKKLKEPTEQQLEQLKELKKLKDVLVPIVETHKES